MLGTARSLHDRPQADSGIVSAELAEHAVAQIPGAQYAGATVTTPAATHG
ncbi:MAG TPA: hypothetical protein VMU34_15310 [Mycobacterium sp.]|nr:hypothetical protein [Mycobacterium sp.]